MSGYCIGLYKYMRVDENLLKREKLEKNQKEVFNAGHPETHKRFFTYGEFDRIGFERVEKFSKFRDISEDAKGWTGDRQTHLIYDIYGDDGRDEIFYEDGYFYEWQENKVVQSDRLFLGLTILQFKFSQKEKYQDMEKLLRLCKSSILQLVKGESTLDVKCAVFGTLGSYGLTIIWLADQYEDVLRLVTKIRNMSLEGPEGKSIFLSAYTIFAQNHKMENSKWEERMQKVRGDAVLHLTLKTGLERDIKEKLDIWKKADSSLYHSAGEHDVFIQMRSADIFDIFKNELNCDAKFFRDFVLQTNVQLCEVIQGEEQNAKLDGQTRESENEKVEEVPSLGPAGEDNGKKEKEPLPELEDIQKAYTGLRKEFEKLFPSTAGMVDTLDMLYSDYIAKISTASNEMWADNFSHQFLRVLTCITRFIEHLDDIELKKKDILDVINDLLCDFERQISHIAESNNLVLGTPICQFRYSGQNNLTLYAYFGIIKRALQFVYEVQEVSAQDEIIPLIVTDIVPIIQSKLFFEYNKTADEAKIVTINLPMTALYNPVCYYPYLYHEVFHYIVPRDRHIRNKVLGALMSIRLLHSSFREILYQEVSFDGEQETLNRYIEVYLLRHIYVFVIENYEDYIGKDIEVLDGETLVNQRVNELTLPSSEYESRVLRKWFEWIKEEGNVGIGNNFMYAFMEHLYEQADNLRNEFVLWKNSCMDASVAGEVEVIGKQMEQFIEKLGGIVENGDIETTSKNFVKLTEPVTDEVLYEANTLIEAIKEGMADTAMVAMGNIDFDEYLLLFTKTKKDLLMGCESIEVQDIIRIGMVLEYLCEDRPSDDDNMDAVDGAKETYVNMYCGLYYSSHKSIEPNYKEMLFGEAQEWFLHGRECYSRYIAQYRLYVALLRKLHKSMLVSGVEGKHLQDMKDDYKYWKEYASALKDCGNYMRENDIKAGNKKWDEKRSFIEKRIFEQNMQLIYKHQFQCGFEELNKIRKNRIKACGDKVYDNNMFRLETAELKTKVVGEVPVGGYRKIQWEYKIKEVGELSTRTAEIARQLERQSNRVLGKGEYPIWYRGHQSADYKLIPSIMRNYKEKKAKCKEGTRLSLASVLRKEYEEFKFRADGTSEAVERVGYTDSDYIALMQHYSVSSNFLDWTEDALSALYFALEDFFDEKTSKDNKNAALYVFSPALYNYARQKMIRHIEESCCRKLEIEREVAGTVKQDGIPNLTVSYNSSKYNMYQLGNEKHVYDNSEPLPSEGMKKGEWIYYLPLAVYVSRLNKRIQAQSGIFLAYNIYTAPDKNDEFDYISLEKIQEHYLNNYMDDREICPFLYKIEIEEFAREKISDWAKAFGMSKEKCYPELASIGERIMR